MEVFPRRRIAWRLLFFTSPALIITPLALRKGGDALWLLPPVWVLCIVADMLVVRKYLRRRALASEGLDGKDRSTLSSRVSFYQSLDPGERSRFERDIAVFLGEHRISGVAGVEVTREIELLIACSAIRLIFGHPNWEYPDFGEILVYPGSFRTDGSYSTDVTEKDVTAAGQVHSQGGVIISLPHLLRSFDQDNDGFNVGYHEFAHVLDGLPHADGIPGNLSLGAYLPWIEVMQREFERVHSGRSMLRAYAGTSPAEFFACAVEAFFEKPQQMRRKAPELYEQLSGFFNQAPGAGEKGPD